MKNIKEYLNKDYYISYKLPNKNGFRTFEEFMELNGYTEENIFIIEIGLIIQIEILKYFKIIYMKH